MCASTFRKVLMQMKVNQQVYLLEIN